jgi:hypothetical protein
MKSSGHPTKTGLISGGEYKNLYTGIYGSLISSIEM